MSEAVSFSEIPFMLQASGIFKRRYLLPLNSVIFLPPENSSPVTPLAQFLTSFPPYSTHQLSPRIVLVNLSSPSDESHYFLSRSISVSYYTCLFYIYVPCFIGYSYLFTIHISHTLLFSLLVVQQSSEPHITDGTTMSSSIQTLLSMNIPPLLQRWPKSIVIYSNSFALLPIFTQHHSLPLIQPSPHQ